MDEPAETPGDVNGPAVPKIVRVDHKDFSAESERQHFERQIVKRR